MYICTTLISTTCTTFNVNTGNIGLNHKQKYNIAFFFFLLFFPFKYTIKDKFKRSNCEGMLDRGGFKNNQIEIGFGTSKVTLQCIIQLSDLGFIFATKLGYIPL
jgi:hypothetical protein